MPEAAPGARRRCPEFVTLVMPHGWARPVRPAQSAAARTRCDPRLSAAPALVRGQGPAAAVGARAGRGEIAAPRGRRRRPPGSFCCGIVEAQLADGERQRYFLPLAAVWAPAGSELRQPCFRHPRRIAPVPPRGRARRRVGAGRLRAGDGRRDAAPGSLPVRCRRRPRGEIRFRQTPLFDRVAAARDVSSSRRLGAEQSNSSVLFEDYAMLKVYRRLQPGPHPEIEMCALPGRAGRLCQHAAAARRRSS